MELLFWDMETNTPKLGFEGHAEALTFFSTEQFKLSTAQELGTMLDELTKSEEFSNPNRLSHSSMKCTS